MGPAIGQGPGLRGLLRIGQPIVAGVAVDQERAAGAALQDLLRHRAAAAGGVVEDHDRRIAAAPSALIAQHHPEPVLAHGAGAWGQHRQGCLVHLQPIAAAQLGHHRVDHGCQQLRRPPRPFRQHAAVELDPLPAADLGLAVERQVVPELGHHAVGDQRLGRQPARHQPFRRRRLSMLGAIAGAADVFRAHRHQHAELRGDDVQPLDPALAHLLHRTAAAGAGGAVGLDHLLDARQVRRQVALVGLGRPRRLLPGAGGLVGRLAGRCKHARGGLARQCLSDHWRSNGSPSNGRLCWSGSRFSDVAPKAARRICASSRSSRARASSTSARRVCASMRAASAEVRAASDTASRRSRSATRAVLILLDAMARGYPPTPCNARENGRPRHPAAAIPPAVDAAAARLEPPANPDLRTAPKTAPAIAEAHRSTASASGTYRPPASCRPARARSGPRSDTSPRRRVSTGVRRERASGSSAAPNEQRAAAGIVPQNALHDQRKASMALAKIDRPRRQIRAGDPDRQGHEALRSAAMTRPRCPGSKSAGTRIRTPPTSSVSTPPAGGSCPSGVTPLFRRSPGWNHACAMRG